MTDIYTISPDIEQVTLSPALFITPPVQEVTVPFVFLNNRRLNVIYDFQITQDAERGLVLDPPVTFTNASESSLFNFKMNTNITIMTANANWFIQFFNDDQTSLISDSNNAAVIGSQARESLSNIKMNASRDGGDWVEQEDGTWSLEFSLDWDAVYWTAFDGAFTAPGEFQIPFAFREICRSTVWNGRLGFTILNFAFLNPTISGFEFSGPAIQFHTGREGSENSQGRPVHDMKMGDPEFAPNMQEDGFYEGIWTRASSWDHKDPMEESPYEPPETEREREDEYPL